MLSTIRQPQPIKLLKVVYVIYGGKTVNLNLFTHFQSCVNYQKTFFFVNKLQFPTFQTKLSTLYALKAVLRYVG